MPDFTSRREFLKAGSAAGLVLGASRLDAAQVTKPRTEDLARLMTAPVLRRELLTSPVRIESIDLIKAGDQFLVRARSTDGAIGRWKASPGHNTNLLLPHTRKICLALADADNRYGRYWALVLGQ